MTVVNINQWELLGIQDIEIPPAERKGRGEVELGLDVNEVPQVALLGRLEGIELVRVGFRHVVRRRDAVIQDDHGTAT